ncbi:MAG: hypothetical protein WA303_09625, partial [Bradyrhizobium sp.]
MARDGSRRSDDVSVKDCDDAINVVAERAMSTKDPAHEKNASMISTQFPIARSYSRSASDTLSRETHFLA